MWIKRCPKFGPHPFKFEQISLCKGAHAKLDNVVCIALANTIFARIQIALAVSLIFKILMGGVM